MSYTNRGFITVTVLLTAAAPLLAPVGLRAQAPSTPAKAAQSTSSAPAEKGERWLHVRANCTDGKGGSKKSQVEVKVPMKVIEALLSAGKDELDLVAALHALGAQGDTELVSVKDSENTVKVWLDSKSVAE